MQFNLIWGAYIGNQLLHMKTAVMLKLFCLFFAFMPQYNWSDNKVHDHLDS